MIVPNGRRFLLLSHEGKVLGDHPSPAAAARQERAINISKARAAGHRIPPPPRRRSKRK